MHLKLHFCFSSTQPNIGIGIPELHVCNLISTECNFPHVTVEVLALIQHQWLNNSTT